jgi:hypothetical protein
MVLFPFFRACWQLLCYVVLGLPVLLLLSPSAPFIRRFYVVWLVWIWFDRMVCTIAHGTWKRTISGWTGQHLQHKKRYDYQANCIDLLALLFGDDKQHCQRAFQWEQEKGLVK